MLSYFRNVRILVLIGLLTLAVVFNVARNRAVEEGRTFVVEDVVRVVLQPLQNAGTTINRTAGNATESFRTRASLLRQNESLRAEVRKLTEENSLLKDQAEQNIRLRRALDFKTAIALPVASAQIIGRDASGWFSTCTIDRGSRDGVRPGYAVTSYLGLVGQVSGVSPTSSNVLMLSDSSSSVGAMVQRSRVNGICQGQNSDTLILNYMPIDADVEVGDIVVSSGIGNLVPKGLPIGIIIAVAPDLTGFTKHALVKPSVKFEQLENVLVVIRAVEE